MKPALFAVLIAVKVATFAAHALAASEGGPPGFQSAAGVIAAEPLGGGYRRKRGEDEPPA